MKVHDKQSGKKAEGWGRGKENQIPPAANSMKLESSKRTAKTGPWSCHVATSLDAILSHKARWCHWAVDACARARGWHLMHNCSLVVHTQCVGLHIIVHEQSVQQTAYAKCSVNTVHACAPSIWAKHAEAEYERVVGRWCVLCVLRLFSCAKNL